MAGYLGNSVSDGLSANTNSSIILSSDVKQLVTKKFTAIEGKTGQFSTDFSSGGLVRSAHRSPTDTPGVPFDTAKIGQNPETTKFLAKTMTKY